MEESSIYNKLKSIMLLTGIWWTRLCEKILTLLSGKPFWRVYNRTVRDSHDGHVNSTYCGFNNSLCSSHVGCS